MKTVFNNSMVAYGRNKIKKTGVHLTASSILMVKLFIRTTKVGLSPHSSKMILFWSMTHIMALQLQNI